MTLDNNEHSVLDVPPVNPTKGNKIATKIAAIALVIIAISIGTILYWASASNEVLKINKQPFPTRTIREHPTAGGVVFLTVDYCKNVDVTGSLRISFVSQSREVFLPVTAERGPKGCDEVEIPILIPKDIEPDTYRVKLRVSYDVNPIKQGIVQEFYSQPVIIDPINNDNQLPSGSLPAQRQ